MSNKYELLHQPRALLVLRVWIERGSARPLRAHSRRTADASRGFEQTSTETDVEATVASVRTWLTGLVGARSGVGAAAISLNGHGLPAGNHGDGPDGPDGEGVDSTNGAHPGH